MIIENDDRLNHSTIWLTNSEKGDLVIKATVETVCKANIFRGYKTVVFESGEHDLYEDIESLIIRNI